MTVSSTTSKVSYSGNGSTTVFAYTFKVFDEDDLTVILRNDSTGNETVQAITTNYTVSGVGNAGGGNVTFVTAPASGITVVIRRASSQTQTTDYTPNDPFPAEAHEDALDKLTFIAQEVQEELDRAIKISRTNTMTSTEFTVGSTDRANKVLAFDSNGEIAVTQEIGTYQGTDATITTSAYKQRDLIKSTTAAQLDNVYICVADSVVGDLLTDTDHFELIVDAVSAATSATNAATSASAAATSASNAATSETNAATSETNAATSETNAATSATDAQTAQAAAEAALDTFDDRFLGAKATDPTLDNDGNALLDGALYFDTTNDIMKVYDLTNTQWRQLTLTSANQANVNTVAGEISPTNNIATVAGDSSDIQTLAGISSDITTTSGISANVTTVAGISSDVTNAATNSADITTVAGEISPTNNISTVAGISSDITAVAGDATDIGTVATDLAGSNNIGTVAGAISNVNAVGGDIANVNTVATNISGVNSFAERYRVGASDPTTSLDEGDLAYNSTDNALKYYDGTSWASITAGLTDIVGDVTPQLGGNLDLNSNDITGTGNIDVTGTVTADNVGIGEASPQSELHITAANPTIRLEDSDNDGQGHIYGGGGSLSLRSDHNNILANSNMTFLVDGSERMRLDSSGRLGLGTTSPSFPLDISGSDFVGIHYERSGTSNPAMRLSNATTGSLAQIEGSNSGELILKNGAGTLSEAMRIDSSGNVGIGTSSPAKTLDVNTASATFRIRDASGGNDFSVKSIAGPVSLAGSEANTAIGFMTNNSEKVRITSSGNVGIAKTNPSTALDVSGEGTFSGDVTLSGTGALKLPEGTTAQRPTSPQDGMVRYNSTENEVEFYRNGDWRYVTNSASFTTSGGDETQTIGDYKYHVFTSTGNFVVTGTADIEVCSVGGGGGGGSDNGGGGGAGEVDVWTTISAATGTYVATVASGGAGNSGGSRGAQGGTSTFALSGGSTLVTSLGGGGGGGGGSNNAGGSGGSGGGSGLNGGTGGSASGSNTNAGGASGTSSAPDYATGGGGGFSAAGGNGNPPTASGAGGAGEAWADIDSNITTSAFTSISDAFFAAGGGGGGNSVTAGAGGTGGGGGGNTNFGNGTNASSYGSGGGGAGNGGSTSGGNGSPGIIIVRVNIG